MGSIRSNNRQGTVFFISTMENGQVVEFHKKGRPYKWAGCTKFGKSINGQGTIRVSRVAKFSEMNKWASPFIRQVRVALSSKSCHGITISLIF